jgi:hypothetical protein
VCRQNTDDIGHIADVVDVQMTFERFEIAKDISASRTLTTDHGSRNALTSLDHFQSLKLLYRYQFEATWSVSSSAYRLRYAFRVMMKQTNLWLGTLLKINHRLSVVSYGIG